MSSGAEVHHGTVPRRTLLSVAVAIGVAGFGFTILSSNRLTNDHYMHLAYAQQVLLGDVPGRDFVDPGMPLMFSLSAAVQHLWPGPFSEAVLDSALLGLAASFTFLMVGRVAGSGLAGAAAAVMQVCLVPRLYAYPKILVPAATLWAFEAYIRRPSAWSRLALVVVLGLSMLLRHDLGAFAFLAVTAGIVVGRGSDWKWAAREVLCVWVGVFLTITPYLVLVQLSEGLAENLREGIEFSKGEAHQLLLPWARPPHVIASSADNAGVVVLYYAAYALIPVGLAVFASTWRLTARPAAVTAIVLLACYCLIIMRHPLDARIPDLGAVLAVVGTLVTLESVRQLRERITVPLARATATTVVLLFAVWPLHAGWQIAGVPARITETRVADGFEKVTERVSALAAVGSQWPWTWYWPAGDMPPVVDYIASCTEPTDRILVTWFAPEYYFFSRRGFAAGHATFSPGAAFVTERDVAKMVERMQVERVPLVLRNESTHEAFASAYPALDALLDANYDWFAHFTLRDESIVRVGSRRGLSAHSQFGPLGWPCQFKDEPAVEAQLDN
jgi:hypothetical protein